MPINLDSEVAHTEDISYRRAMNFMSKKARNAMDQMFIKNAFVRQFYRDVSNRHCSYGLCQLARERGGLQNCVCSYLGTGRLRPTAIFTYF